MSSFQIIITGELKGDEYAAYRALTDKANEADVERIIEGVGQEKDDAVREHYRVLLRLVIEKNPQFIEVIRRGDTMTYEEMDDALMEILKDKVDEKVNEMVNEMVQQTTVTYLNIIMTKLKYTAEQAMDFLNIPTSQRGIYSGLVGNIQ